MVRFAAKVYGQFSVRYSTQNIDNLLVGWQFNAAALGFYKKAYDLFALSASQLTAPLDNVALAALSRLNQDPARFRRYLANSLGIIAFVGMAVSADLTLVGKDVVRLVLGPQWSESGRIFELFGPGIGAMLLYSTVGWIHLSIGKPGRWLRWTSSGARVTVSLFLGRCPGGQRELPRRGASPTHDHKRGRTGGEHPPSGSGRCDEMGAWSLSAADMLAVHRLAACRS